jgi:hypothetical protein
VKLKGQNSIFLPELLKMKGQYFYQTFNVAEHEREARDARSKGRRVVKCLLVQNKEIWLILENTSHK